ncbi:MAG TPA: hypothetical protein VIY08_01645, partial [Candidatus Nitrosocosmicus sp.]
YCMSTRNRTSSNIIGYGLYLYFLGLSFRNTAKTLSFLKIIKISPFLSGNGFKSTGPGNISRIKKSRNIS